MANTQTQIDVSVFTQWVDAALRDEADLATFFQQRFRDEFKPAFRAWLRTDPFEDPSAPPSPFAMDEYQLAATQETKKLSATAEASAELARTYTQHATNYVLGVVLFATSLFFAGISTKLNSTRLRESSSASDASCSSWLPPGSPRSRSVCRSEVDRRRRCDTDDDTRRTWLLPPWEERSSSCEFFRRDLAGRRGSSVRKPERGTNP